MKTVTALFCGLGSIGKRHLRALRHLREVRIIRYRSGKSVSEVCEDIGEIVNVDSIKKAFESNPDFAVISNPTALHVDTALELAEAGLPFLIEKPVSDRSEGLKSLTEAVKNSGLTAVMVGFQLRHHPGYIKTIELIKRGAIGEPLHLQGYVGQYLPDWRPNVDYSKSYSASRELGGGVILDLCHEIDIAMSIFGDVQNVCCMADKISNLAIETEDVADIILLHEKNRQSSIHLNYLERSYAWGTTISGAEGTLCWDYGTGNVRLRTANQEEQIWSVPSGFTRDDLFTAQMRHWLDVLAGDAVPMVDLNQGIKVTKAALAAKTSAQVKRFIDPHLEY